MRKLNWDEVTAASSGIMQPGAYAIEITDVKDNEKYECLEVVYDVIEGEYAGRFKNMTPDEDWKHQFRQAYSDKAMPFFKRFLDELEGDNPSFTIANWQVTSDPKALIGLKLGMLFREYRYINQQGEAKWRLDADRPLSLAEVAHGDVKAPKPRYSNQTTEAEWTAINGFGSETEVAETTESVYDGSIPF